LSEPPHSSVLEGPHPRSPTFWGSLSIHLYDSSIMRPFFLLVRPYVVVSFPLCFCVLARPPIRFFPYVSRIVLHFLARIILLLLFRPVSTVHMARFTHSFLLIPWFTGMIVSVKMFLIVARRGPAANKFGRAPLELGPNLSPWASDQDSRPPAFSAHLCVHWLRPAWTILLSSVFCRMKKFPLLRKE